MEWLNYHHLYYFWMAAREGSIVKSSARLFVSQPTISAQIKSLEDALGEKLFLRKGRKLELTEAGQIALRYADEIFGLGREMQDTLKGRPSAQRPALRVGISDVVPKMVAHRILRPVFQSYKDLQLICREDHTEGLFADLAAHRLDVLLTDSPLPAGSGLKAFSHLLGESGVVFFAGPRLADLRKRFPAGLDGAPMLLPTSNTSLRHALDKWFDDHGLRPHIVGEFEDSALMNVFGQDGYGIFPGPAFIENDIKAHYGAAPIGRAEEVAERYYAISPERKVKNAVVAKLLETARKGLG
jgi:LysR family transcriptional regulator, transcriptional activator of nhaA